MAESPELKVPDLDEEFEYHCFVAYSKTDAEVVTKLVNYLKQLKFKVAICDEFPLGHCLVDNIQNAVNKSRRAVAFLSKDYKESGWYDHEVLLMIHNNNKRKKQLIVPVCYKLSENEMKETKLGVYNPQYIDYKGSPPDMHRIAQAIAGPDIPLSVSLPCGNVAQGLVWSFYYGYLRIILPGMVDKCKSSRWADHPSIPLIPTLFIIIPDTGYCFSTITDCDSNMKHEGNLEELAVNRGGIKGRSYKNNMYKICRKTGKEYFAPCEYATPVMSMYEMCQDGRAGLSDNEKRHQIGQFKNFLDQILSQFCQPPSGQCHVFKLISFKADEEGKGDISSLIVDSIEQMLQSVRSDRPSGIP